jgi:Tol biopolymer transport system component
MTVGLAFVSIGCATKPPAAEGEILSDIRQLTTGFQRAGEAYFSPDMTWAVFQASLEGERRYRMFIAPVNLDAHGGVIGLGSPIEINTPGSDNTCGYFSPDGRSLLFASTGSRELNPGPPAGYQRQGGRYVWNVETAMDIYRVDNWVEQLPDSGSVAPLAGQNLTAVEGYDAEGGISRDGQWIIFGSNRHNPTRSSNDIDLYAMRIDGSDVVRLTETPGYDGGPFMSPDGRRVIYRSDRLGDDKLQVFVATLVRDGSGTITGLKDERQLTTDDAVSWGPYWHPNSRVIAYATSIHGHDNYEIYLMNVDSGKRCRITFTPGFDGLPTFNQDGRYLLWTSKRTRDGTTQLYSARFTLPAWVK